MNFQDKNIFQICIEVSIRTRRPSAQWLQRYQLHQWAFTQSINLTNFQVYVFSRTFCTESTRLIDFSSRVRSDHPDSLKLNCTLLSTMKVTIVSWGLIITLKMVDISQYTMIIISLSFKCLIYSGFVIKYWTRH